MRRFTPSVIGRYSVLEHLGDERVGASFLGEDPGSKRRVVIKCLTWVGAGQLAEVVRRLADETAAAGSLLHPNLVPVLEAGTVDEVPFVVWEHLPGQSLAKLVTERSAASLKRRLGFIFSLCDGLAHAHEQGVLHGDISLGNLIVHRDSAELKVAGFGLAPVLELMPSDRSVRDATPTTDRAGSIGRGEDVRGVAEVMFALLTYQTPEIDETGDRVVPRVQGTLQATQLPVPDTLITIVDAALSTAATPGYRTISLFRSELERAYRNLDRRQLYSSIAGSTRDRSGPRPWGTTPTPDGPGDLPATPEMGQSRPVPAAASSLTPAAAQPAPPTVSTEPTVADAERSRAHDGDARADTEPHEPTPPAATPPARPPRRLLVPTGGLVDAEAAARAPKDASRVNYRSRDQQFPGLIHLVDHYEVMDRGFVDELVADPDADPLSHWSISTLTRHSDGGTVATSMGASFVVQILFVLLIVSTFVFVAPVLDDLPTVPWTLSFTVVETPPDDLLVRGSDEVTDEDTAPDLPETTEPPPDAAVVFAPLEPPPSLPPPVLPPRPPQELVAVPLPVTTQPVISLPPTRSPLLGRPVLGQEDTFREVDVPPALLAEVVPEWPVDAAQRQVEGTVYMAVTVDQDGAVARVDVVPPVPDAALVRAAQRAASELTFRPAIEIQIVNDERQEFTVASRVFLYIDFKRLDIR